MSICRTFKRFGAMVAFALALVAVTHPAAANRWGRDYIPNLPVVTQDGRTLRFYDDVVQGRRLVISFIFTSCRDMCPLITARLTQVYEALGDAAGRDVQFVSISVDPANDTPAKLKEHADAFRVGPGWLFLTGSVDDIKAIRHRLGDRATNILDHRQDIWLVNDATGDWQRDSAFSEVTQLVLNIHAMLPGGTRNFKPPMQTATGQSPQLPGQVLFAKACAACHSIGGGDKVGPDLAGVTRRHERPWLTSFIATPQRYHRDKDPVALALAERFKAVRMPNLGLKPGDISDVIAYIDARTFAAENPAPAGHAHQGQHGHGQHGQRAADRPASKSKAAASKGQHQH